MKEVWGCLVAAFWVHAAYFFGLLIATLTGCADPGRVAILGAVTWTFYMADQKARKAT